MKTKQIIKALRADGGPTRYLAIEAANRLEMLSAEQKKLHEKLKAMKAERDALMADLKEDGGCASCKHTDLPVWERPCFDCTGTSGKNDNWEWRGAKDINVPNKKEENHA